MHCLLLRWARNETHEVGWSRVPGFQSCKNNFPWVSWQMTKRCRTKDTIQFFWTDQRDNSVHLHVQSTMGMAKYLERDLWLGESTASDRTPTGSAEQGYTGQSERLNMWQQERGKADIYHLGCKLRPQGGKARQREVQEGKAENAGVR